MPPRPRTRASSKNTASATGSPVKGTKGSRSTGTRTSSPVKGAARSSPTKSSVSPRAPKKQVNAHSELVSGEIRSLSSPLTVKGSGGALRATHETTEAVDADDEDEDQSEDVGDDTQSVHDTAVAELLDLEAVESQGEDGADDGNKVDEDPDAYESSFIDDSGEHEVPEGDGGAVDDGDAVDGDEDEALEDSGSNAEGDDKNMRDADTEAATTPAKRTIVSDDDDEPIRKKKRVFDKTLFAKDGSTHPLNPASDMHEVWFGGKYDNTLIPPVLNVATAKAFLLDTDRIDSFERWQRLKLLENQRAVKLQPAL
ncbi:hypothetical protein EIP86_001630 [Pleurotus ostreatoroseus]|nr:hypothetical protein EIP86_001630 [Pleurotus ostreatoroseus]